jgi:hypothetical protein
VPDSSEPSSKESAKPAEPAVKKPAKKAAARKSTVAVPVAKSAAKQAPSKKAAAKKPATKKASAKKPAAKKAPANKASKQPAPLRGKQAVTDAKRLSGWDFATWRMATDDPVMRSTIIGLLVLDSSPDWERMKQRYDRATRLAPVLRSRVVEGPQLRPVLPHAPLQHAQGFDLG